MTKKILTLRNAPVTLSVDSDAAYIQINGADQLIIHPVTFPPDNEQPITKEEFQIIINHLATIFSS